MGAEYEPKQASFSPLIDYLPLRTRFLLWAMSGPDSSFDRRPRAVDLSMASVRLID